MVTIINYGMGNLESVANMLKKVGVKSAIASEPRQIESAEKLILPGVGSFDAGMDNLRNLGIIELLNKKVIEGKTPILGICLGMQLLAKNSEEGAAKGLYWIDGNVRRFRFDSASAGLKIPHMGWNTIIPRGNSRLFRGLESEARFYFVHSYHMVCNDANDTAAITNHGYDFVAAVEKGNIFGVQFHPEKSHKFGMQILKNFAEL